jgi:superfamily II DNA or RNA helicase
VQKVKLFFEKGTITVSGLNESSFSFKYAVYDKRSGNFRCDALHYTSLKNKILSETTSVIEDDISVFKKIKLRKADLPELRPDQVEALSAWKNNNNKGLIVMPTGTGKTVVALAAIRDCGVSTLVVAPVRDLMYQWQRRMEDAFECDVGIVGDNIYNIRPLTVTTYDSAYIHMPEIGNKFGLVIFDEVHHLPGKSRREAALFSAAEFRMGLTATPERSDGKDADFPFLIGPEVYRLAMKRARGETLADYSVVKIPVRLSGDEQLKFDKATQVIKGYVAEKVRDDKNFSWKEMMKSVAEDHEARAVQKAYYLKQSIEDRAEEKLKTLEDIFRLHLGERVLVFAGSNAMALDVSKRFLVPTLLSHSRKKERREVLEKFASGKFPVLVANQVLDEGVDIPQAKIAVVVGGKISTRQAKQRLGRILRQSGRAKAVLYEVFCAGTGENKRSLRRHKSDAFDDVKKYYVSEGKNIAYGRSRNK